MNNKLILRRNGFDAFQGWQLWLQVFAVLLLFVSIGFIFSISGNITVFNQPFVYGTVAYAIFLYFYRTFIVSSKLEIDDFGISHKSALPEILKYFLRDWSVSWSEIKKVEKAKNTLLTHTVLLPLNLTLLNRTIKLIPSHWVDPKDEVKKSWLTRYSNLAQLFEDTRLVKILEEKGFLTVYRSKTLGKRKSIGTDISSSPISLGMAAFLFFAMFYFIIEVYFTLSEFYASTPPYIYMIIGAVFAVILSYFLLLKTKFVLAEKIMLALLMGGSIAAVMYPMMLRVNEWTDTEGLKNHTYVKSGIVDWMSDRNNFQVPTLRFDLASSKYWAQFEIGDSKDFELRKGGLGFYQLNMEPVYEEQRAFYKDDL